MTDITNRNLEAAIIDQVVAGQFRGKRYAFMATQRDDGPWTLSVAVENERGYNPIDGKSFTTRKEAREWADGLNDHLGLTSTEITAIVMSTMMRA
jgi:hypothetical protein